MLYFPNRASNVKQASFYSGCNVDSKIHIYQSRLVPIDT